MRRLIATTLLVAACSGGGSDLTRIATEACAVLDDPATSPAARSLVVYESTTEAIELGYTEEAFADALRQECGDSVIVGGGS